MGLNHLLTSEKLNRIELQVHHYLLFCAPLLIFFIEKSLDLDITWFRAINLFGSYLPDYLWTWLSLLGNGWACFALAFPLLVLAPRILFAGVISGLLTGILSRILKLWINSPRPAGVLDQNTFHIIDHPLLHSSMPSGHTMTVFGLATVFYFATPKSKRLKYLALYLLAIGTALSRIAVGAHWPQDVLVGSSLGIVCGLGGIVLARKIPEKLLALKKFPSFICILGSLVCFYILISKPLDFLINQSIQFVLAALIALTWLYILTRKRRNEDMNV